MHLSRSTLNTRVQGTFQSLHHRNFRLFFIGQTISNTGNWLTNVALTLFLLSLTGTGVGIGFLAACQYGPALFLSAWAGALADGGNKRKLLYVTQALEMCQSVVLAVLAFHGNPPLWLVYSTAIGGGILLALDNPLRRSFVSEMVPKSDLPNAVVLYSTVVNMSRIMGPALAGLLATTVGFGWCFLLDAVSYLAVLLCLYLMRSDELHRAPVRPSRKGAVRAGFRYVAETPVLWITFAMFAAISICAYNFTVTLPLFVTKTLDSSDRTFTLLYSLYALGALLTALVVANRNAVGMRQILFGACALGVTMIVLSIVPGVPLAIPVMLALGTSSILFMTGVTTIVQLVAKPEMHGRVLALQTMIMMGSTAISAPIVGWAADSFGVRVVIAFGGVVAIASAAFGYAAFQRRTPEVLRVQRQPNQELATKAGHAD